MVTCSIWVDPNQLLIQHGGTAGSMGDISWLLDMPVNPSLLFVPLCAQGFSLPTVDPRASNALLFSIGGRY